MRLVTHIPVFTLVLSLFPAFAGAAEAQVITAAGQPAQLDIRAAGESSLRVTLKPSSLTSDLPANPALADRSYPASALSLRDSHTINAKESRELPRRGAAEPAYCRCQERRRSGCVQEVIFETDGTLSFALDDHPVLGMGEGGPRPEKDRPWREQPVQFDRRGALDTMEPRWQSDMYGSRNPVAMLLGTGGLGPVRRRSVGTGRSSTARPRRLHPVQADREGECPSDRAEPATGAGEGDSTDRSDDRGTLRLLHLRRARSRESDQGLLNHHRAGRHAAEVGARLHAVASYAPRRPADDRGRRHVPVQAHPARRGHLPRHRLRAARLEHQAAVVRLQSRRLHARPQGGRWPTCTRAT